MSQRQPQFDGTLFEGGGPMDGRQGRMVWSEEDIDPSQIAPYETPAGVYRFSHIDEQRIAHWVWEPSGEESGA